MMWNNQNAYWAARKYDSDGNVIYTIDNLRNTEEVDQINKINKDEITIDNYPNPFNPSTTISYRLPSQGYVSIKVYDMLGQEIVALVNEQQNKGIHTTNFDGTNLSSGIYFYKMFVNNEVIATRRFMLIK